MIRIDNLKQLASAQVSSWGLEFKLETDFNSENHSAFPKDICLFGVSLNELRFGFGGVFDFFTDFKYEQSDKAEIFTSRGYENLCIARVPFIEFSRYVLKDYPYMYEKFKLHHSDKKIYAIGGISEWELWLNPLLNQAVVHTKKGYLSFQFYPLPVFASYSHNDREWQLQFESSEVEVLIGWTGGEISQIKKFESISGELINLEVQADNIKRSYNTTQKHSCLLSGERIVFPEGERLTNLTAKPKNGLYNLAILRESKTTISVGECKVFVLDDVKEVEKFPMFQPYLVRALRSLRERIIWNVVTEDDPTSYYLWGSGTWPRCFSVLSLDYFKMSKEAFEYLEFFFKVSDFFKERDGVGHLFDSYTIKGEPRIIGAPRNLELYDINGHSIKLFEACKFYLNHQDDYYGDEIRNKYYDVIKDWCIWIDKNTNEDGLIVDVTESNVWSIGYGTFTQAPSAAGVYLFSKIAMDANKIDDQQRFEALANKLTDALNTRLYGSCENEYLNINGTQGKSYFTYIPREIGQKFECDNTGMKDTAIGLSCYSLAAAFFMCDPDVMLINPRDNKIISTQTLAMKLLGDNFDKRIPTWHIGCPAHMGYGAGQLLTSLLYSREMDNFYDTLDAVFEVSKKETGDIFLMQEVLARSGRPNRGNKAHLGYFPFIAYNYYKLNV